MATAIIVSTQIIVHRYRNRRKQWSGYIHDVVGTQMNIIPVLCDNV